MSEMERQKFIMDNLHLCDSVIKTFIKGRNRYHYYDDLYSVACETLIKCVDNYTDRTENSASFRSYFYQSVRYKLSMEIKRNENVIYRQYRHKDTYTYSIDKIFTDPDKSALYYELQDKLSTYDHDPESVLEASEALALALHLKKKGEQFKRERLLAKNRRASREYLVRKKREGKHSIRIRRSHKEFLEFMEAKKKHSLERKEKRRLERLERKEKMRLKEKIRLNESRDVDYWKSVMKNKDLSDHIDMMPSLGLREAEDVLFLKWMKYHSCGFIKNAAKSLGISRRTLSNWQNRIKDYKSMMESKEFSGHIDQMPFLSLREMEDALYLKWMKYHDYNFSETTKSLGVSQRTVRNWKNGFKKRNGYVKAKCID